MSKVQPRTTIDNLHIEAHQRYAQDQHMLDPRFMVDTSSITQHAELAGTSSIYSSQLDQLIQTYAGILPWASFHPPVGFLTQTNRFFRSRLFPRTKQGFHHNHEEEDSGEDARQEKDGEKEEENPLIHLLELAIERTSHASKRVERDKTLLISLLQKIDEIDALLAFINTRKLQYQKG